MGGGVEWKILDLEGLIQTLVPPFTPLNMRKLTLEGYITHQTHKAGERLSRKRKLSLNCGLESFALNQAP